MPAIPVEWGLEIWCLANTKSKYVWTFDVYCESPKGIETNKKSEKGDAKQEMNVFKKNYSRV